MHQGGCGGYAQSDRWSDYYGVAFGMKYSNCIRE
jgi:hypothetical protein